MSALVGINHVTALDSKVGRVVLKQHKVQEIICQVRGRQSLSDEYVCALSAGQSLFWMQKTESSEEKHRAVLTAGRSPPSLSYCYRASFRAVNYFVPVSVPSIWQHQGLFEILTVVNS